jgi:hypothetical protein
VLVYAALTSPASGDAAMSRRTRLLAVAVLLAATTATPAAPPDVLDLVPEDAALALAIRNITDLKKKGDKFFADASIKEESLPRPSALFEGLYGWLGIKGGLDEDAPAAFLVANARKAGRDKIPYDPEILKLLVLAVPFKDRGKIADSFGLNGDDLKDGKVVEGTGRWEKFFFRTRGRHLLLGGSKKAIESVVEGKSVAAALSEKQRQSLAGADILIHFGPDSWGDTWGDFLKDMQTSLGKDRGEADRQVIADLAAALKTIRFGLGAIRIDDGFGLSLVGAFPEKVPEATRRFLASVAGGSEPCDLKGLPNGPVVFAEGSKGDGAQNVRVMTILADFALRDLSEVSQAKWLPSPTDRANVLAAFTEVWKRLKGHRVAVYANADPGKHGLFSAVAILDTAGADRFLADLKQLTRLSGGEGIDLSGNGRRDDIAEVERLIRDLGSEEFDARESAGNRLALIGEPALPLIRKALKSGDAEVRRRAEALIVRISEAAVARRKELLSKESPWRLRPTFRFEAKPEERAGHAIETARIRLTEKDAPAADALRQVFGPDWDRVRLAAHGKQVVVLLGSDERLLDAALANLKDGKPGLAASKPLAAFARQADAGRKLELHAALGTVLELLRGEDLLRARPVGPAPALSSASLAVEPDRLRLDLWLPASEVGAIVKGSAR